LRRKLVVPSFSDAVLESVARAIGSAGEPLTGAGISRIFSACNIEDKSAESTKWKRLHHTFRALQQHDGCANNVCAFLETALAPARWSGNGDGHTAVREAVNRALMMAGIEIATDGKVRSVKAATTVGEAGERVNRLQTKMEQRSVHPEVLKTCRTLMLRDSNYFHAVFEITKGIADRLRSMAKLSSDGAPLIDETLEKGSRPFPIIALNSYNSASLVNDQKGIAHLARGLLHAFRHVTAHETHEKWHISEDDALDMISIASLIHRRLDKAVVTTEFQPTSL
jgi:uncharacterized protein (TIGR02391 family)